METGELPKAQYIKDDPLTGTKYRVINPENGADINVVDFYGSRKDANGDYVEKGHDFRLRRGESVEVDETIAKAVAHVWQFLRIEQVGKTKTDVRKNDAEKIENPGFALPTFLDISKYHYNDLQKIAHKSPIENVNKLKKPQMIAQLNNLSEEDLREAVKEAGLEFYSTNQ